MTRWEYSHFRKEGGLQAAGPAGARALGRAQASLAYMTDRRAASQTTDELAQEQLGEVCRGWIMQDLEGHGEAQVQIVS